MTSNHKSNHNPFEHLLSKLIAGGLSAGLVLVWWPALFPNAGVLSWCWRALVWTLLFELLLGALAPLEFALKSSHITRNVKQAITVHFDNLTSFAPRSATASAILLALAALALPAGLILTGSCRANKNTANKPSAVKVVKNVKTVKPVKVIRITKVVRETNGVQVLESTSKKSEGSLTKAPKKKTSKKEAPKNDDQSGSNQSGSNQSGSNQSGSNQSDPAPTPENPPTNAQSSA